VKFNFYIPTKVIYGNECVLENSKLFTQYGKKAIIVTGKHSGKISGALADVIKVLEKEKMQYCIFDKITNNPTLDNVLEGKIFAQKEKVDFVIAIGGGSPMDGAKAIAALCTNDIKPIDLLDNNLENPSLDIIAIPTTAGTGSEITPYAILTIKEKETKRSFSSVYNFPKVSFIDVKYTYTLSDKVTIDTAFDAFSHLLESYLSKKSTIWSDLFAIEGIKAFAKCINGIQTKAFTKDIRDNLMYASYMGGIAITHTGTTIVHAMGYSLTYFKKLSHGHANALLLGAYLRFNYNYTKDKINKVLNILQFDNIDILEQYFLNNVGNKPRMTEAEYIKFSKLAYSQKSVKNNCNKVDEKIIERIYKEVFKYE